LLPSLFNSKINLRRDFMATKVYKEECIGCNRCEDVCPVVRLSFSMVIAINCNDKMEISIYEKDIK
ncbi:MAG TPA: hypothetical protein DHW76_00470, partial [Clostridiaceae bacterium]|jgi:ferredoxin|nr:hypothetical protein [Clostridiaceae bacterium]